MNDQKAFENWYRDADPETNWVEYSDTEPGIEWFCRLGWKAALEWAQTQQDPVEYQWQDDSDGAWFDCEPKQVKGFREKGIPVRGLYFHPAPQPLYESLKQISNLLTHSKPEDYAEVINQCMMLADVAISDWENR